MDGLRITYSRTRRRQKESLPFTGLISKSTPRSKNVYRDTSPFDFALAVVIAVVHEPFLEAVGQLVCGYFDWS